jgi:hypothetical protein
MDTIGYGGIFLWNHNSEYKNVDSKIIEQVEWERVIIIKRSKAVTFNKRFYVICNKYNFDYYRVTERNRTALGRRVLDLEPKAFDICKFDGYFLTTVLWNNNERGVILSTEIYKDTIIVSLRGEIQEMTNRVGHCYQVLKDESILHHTNLRQQFKPSTKEYAKFSKRIDYGTLKEGTYHVRQIAAKHPLNHISAEPFEGSVKVDSAMVPRIAYRGLYVKTRTYNYKDVIVLANELQFNPYALDIPIVPANCVFTGEANKSKFVFYNEDIGEKITIKLEKAYCNSWCELTDMKLIPKDQHYKFIIHNGYCWHLYNSSVFYEKPVTAADKRMNVPWIRHPVPHTPKKQEDPIQKSFKINYNFRIVLKKKEVYPDIIITEPEVSKDISVVLTDNKIYSNYNFRLTFKPQIPVIVVSDHSHPEHLYNYTDIKFKCNKMFRINLYDKNLPTITFSDLSTNNIIEYTDRKFQDCKGFRINLFNKDNPKIVISDYSIKIDPIVYTDTPFRCNHYFRLNYLTESEKEEKHYQEFALSDDGLSEGIKIVEQNKYDSIQVWVDNQISYMLEAYLFILCKNSVNTDFLLVLYQKIITDKKYYKPFMSVPKNIKKTTTSTTRIFGQPNNIDICLIFFISTQKYWVTGMYNKSVLCLLKFISSLFLL